MSGIEAIRHLIKKNLSQGYTAVYKNELLDAIRAVGSKLGRVPTAQDMEAARGITRAEIRKHFASLRQAFRAAGLDPSLDRSHITTKAMLEDWGEVARKMGRVPSSKHYDLCGIPRPPTTRALARGAMYASSSGNSWNKLAQQNETNGRTCWS